MKRLACLLLLVGGSLTVFAQPGQRRSEPTVYQATAERINDLVHTRLDARFDYSKSQLNGKVWITLKPHFYPTDSLALDAKGMDIKSVSLVRNGKNTPLRYGYDKLMLNIRLDRTYRNNENYTVYIEYTAKPDEFQAKGSAAITDAKGLYFINPRGEEQGKPTQIWTQGETEATSVWVPTIDRPNQKTTQEILMTVPSKYVTLSNGKLVSQKTNSDGTRTDHWKMDQPHAPYLFFMGVGDFAVVKDNWRGKEVSYYVEKEYGPVARRIFGKTPEMMTLYSRLLGVEYPWVKYSQIVGRDYVSGAMENTTATLHQESAQQDARELTDGNRWEEVIAHELFHQWFGDLVTAESWSNLTVNESFATIGSQLWNEFHYGKDYGHAERYNSIRQYIGSRSENKHLVRFLYNDKEDMFDAVSYNKGAGILQMLRSHLGDSAFFRSLNHYLVTNRFKAAEAHQLRLSFEEVTGKDLNWFFNQWYFGAGHPKLNITYGYNEGAKQAQVIVEQTTEKAFLLPVKIDVWNGTTPMRYEVWLRNKIDTFNFASASRPALINFDTDKTLVAEKTENKSLEEYLFQYKHAGNYVDRREAIDAALKKHAETRAAEILMAALRDPFPGLRTQTANGLDLSVGQTKNFAEPILRDMARNDKNRPARAAAISKLAVYKNPNDAALFRTALNDSSYSVAGAALEALSRVDSAGAVAEAKRLSAQPAKGRLAASIKRLQSAGGGDAAATLKAFEDAPLQAKFQQIEGVFEIIENTNDLAIFKRAVDGVIALGPQVPEAFRDQVVTAINQGLGEMAKARAENGQKEFADYIESKVPKK